MFPRFAFRAPTQPALDITATGSQEWLQDKLFPYPARSQHCKKINLPARLHGD